MGLEDLAKGACSFAKNIKVTSKKRCPFYDVARIEVKGCNCVLKGSDSRMKPFEEKGDDVT